MNFKESANNTELNTKNEVVFILNAFFFVYTYTFYIHIYKNVYKCINSYFMFL